MSNNKVLLILNGELNLSSKNLNYLLKKKSINKIIAVDGGADKARKLELIPDLIIGDLDSAAEKNLSYFKNKEVKIKKYPIEKNKTDSELAIDYCLEKKYSELYIIAALGGRIDHQLANINLLEYIYNLNLKAKIISNKSEISLITAKKVFRSKENYRLSLIPQSKKIESLTIKGCKYNLKNKNINRSQSRGVSNLITKKKAKITIKNGLLLYVLENIN